LYSGIYIKRIQRQTGNNTDNYPQGRCTGSTDKGKTNEQDNSTEIDRLIGRSIYFG
jgi:hypothetical protein